MPAVVATGAVAHQPHKSALRSSVEMGGPAIQRGRKADREVGEAYQNGGSDRV